MANRKYEIHRKTSETDIKLRLNLDGQGDCTANCGIGFLDHMIQLLAFHAQVDLEVEAKGDLEVDDHHVSEDIGIVFGQALSQALGDKSGINRFGDTLLPMDEVLLAVAMDLSGRSAFVTNYQPVREQVGQFSTEMVPHFFRSLAAEAKLALHLHFLAAGENEHHRIESMFKGVGRALRSAVAQGGSQPGIPSTKGSL